MYKFSKGSFYPYLLKEEYLASGTWPEIGLDCPAEVMQEFTQAAPEGMCCGVGKNGEPKWVPKPPPTPAQIEAGNVMKRDALLREVDSISPVKWASFSKEEQEAWVAYRNQLVALKNSKSYPAYLTWPIKPISKE